MCVKCRLYKKDMGFFSFDSSKGKLGGCLFSGSPKRRFAAGDGCSGHIPARAPIAGLGTLEEVPQGDGENCGCFFLHTNSPMRYRTGN